MKHDSDFVFLEPTGKRWFRIKAFIFLMLLVLFTFLIVFIRALWIQPELQLPDKVRNLKNELHAYEKPKSLYKPMEFWKEFSKTKSHDPARLHRLREKFKIKSDPVKEVRLGFYSGWDENSFESLKKNQNSLTHLTAEWFTVQGLRGEVFSNPDLKLLKYLENRSIAFLPMLTNLEGDEWVSEAIESLLQGSQERREVFFQEIERQLKVIPCVGLHVDFQNIDPAYKANLTDFLRELARRLQAHQQELWVSIPVGHDLRVFDLDALSGFVNHFVAVMHDENGEQDAPGPLASMDWFEGWLKVLMGYGEPQQWVVALGNYGYDWEKGEKEAETISFADAMSRAGASGIPMVVNQAPTRNSTFSYEEQDRRHEVWFLDVISFANQLRIAREYGVGGVGLFRLGAEDPHVWDVWKSEEDEKKIDLQKLQKLEKKEWLSHVGKGEVLTVDLETKEGFRELKRGKRGLWEGVYRQFPKYPTVFHKGSTREDQVVLTFDDGPDPEWTPKILEILKQKKVKASFFVVGNKVEDSPELLKRIYEEGHDVGNHTYTHSNLQEASREQTILELNATQRLIESVLGRSTILFRPPYQADARPKVIEDLKAIQIAQELGYLTVCENIDSEDWERPGADVILRRIKDQRHSGNIILLHDAGGDRRQTVEALPKIIDYLKARGDQIVTLSELLQLQREELMPSVALDHHEAYRRVSSWGFRLIHGIEEFAWAFMIGATLLLLGRTFFIVGIVLRQKQKVSQQASFDGENKEIGDIEGVSVIVPAYNEEKVIQRTLESLLKSNYQGSLEILVIDDGSQDRTVECVRAFMVKEPRVQLIQQKNQGKSYALQNGLEHAKYKIVVLLDADTQFKPETIAELVKPMKEISVAAVSGHVKVGNIRNFVTSCQALEYTCGFNLDRRAYDELNAITVIPGAVCALRKSAVLKVGGFSHNTLAEDTDLTLMLHRHGYQVRYVPEAIAMTEAPENLSGIIKQRMRWSFGTMQCLWKHADLIFNPRMKWLGWMSLPSIWFFQVFLVALVPFVDLLLILSLCLGNGAAVLPFMGLFLGVDLMLAVVASRIEREPMSRVWMIFPMRILYRPLLAYVVWKSLLKVFRGAWMTWNRVERRGSVGRIES